jgi:hypothetical protein
MIPKREFEANFRIFSTISEMFCCTVPITLPMLPVWSTTNTTSTESCFIFFFFVYSNFKVSVGLKRSSNYASPQPNRELMPEVAFVQIPPGWMALQRKNHDVREWASPSPSKYFLHSHGVCITLNEIR